MRKIVTKNGITGLFAGKSFDIFLKNLRLEGKFLNQYQVIIDINMHKLYNIYTYVNTLSYGIFCIYKATDMHTSRENFGKVLINY